MRSPCVPANAAYDKTVTVGSGLFESVTQDLWQWSDVKTAYGLNTTTQTYVTTRSCIAQHADITYIGANLVGAMSLTVYDFVRGISDPALFVVPSTCAGVKPMFLTAEQWQEIVNLFLSGQY